MSGLLVELDEENVAAARRGLQRAGLGAVVAVAGDAGKLDAYAAAVPADLVLVCGVFGNPSVPDVRRTVHALPMLIAAGGTVVWTRHRREPDLTPTIRKWFSELGFVEIEFASPGPDRFAVGAHRLDGEARVFEADDAPLFTFQRQMMALPTAASVGAVNGYRERAIRYAGPRVEGGRLLKEYLISATGETPSAVVIEAGRASVARSLATSAPAGAAGFSVIHQGEDACYYLAYWWAEGCVLHGHAEMAPLDAPGGTTPLWAHAIACTWELVPVAHESQAWVRHVLKPTGEPDMDQWAVDGWSGRA